MDGVQQQLNPYLLLAVITVMPHQQGGGHGQYLRDVAYAVARKRGLNGSPTNDVSPAARRLFASGCLGQVARVLLPSASRHPAMQLPACHMYAPCMVLAIDCFLTRPCSWRVILHLKAVPLHLQPAAPRNTSCAMSHVRCAG